ncbi:hypothetical protein CLV30_105204 [Haloactinopolyspora alba]|uniref:Parallel beta helix pectate lyase-like protein n=2 Tax=Haloactinopolyspora alba TaxID=648780 RepID=A0A2P8E5P1_9ACTN|nr:hypothetical protein CLV30_105204 [Haloactinopolyspora alba]
MRSAQNHDAGQQPGGAALHPRRRSLLVTVLAASLVVGVVAGLYAVLDEPDGSNAGAQDSGPATGPEDRTESGIEEPGASEENLDDSFPTKSSTGPRVPIDSLRPSEPIVTEEDGQEIEGLDVASRIKIINDDVTVRDVRLRFDGTVGTYGIHVAEKDDGTCPENVLIDHVEVSGTDELDVEAIAVYSPCPYVLRDSRIVNVGSAIRITSGATIEHNYIVADLTESGSEAHRSAIGSNGGHDNRIVGNTIECVGAGCSGALVLYGSFSPVENVLVQANLLNTTGSYCTYAGSLESKEYPLAEGVRYIDNRFGRKHFDTCGRYGPVAGASEVNGNVWEGNVWDDTGEPI